MKVESTIKKSMENDIVLFVSSPNKRASFLEKIISLHLKKKGKKFGLISLDKSYSNFSKDLKKKKIDIDKILFIDCVSQKEGKSKEKGNVVYVSSPQAYTEINIAAKKALNAGVDGIIFDSLSNILLYGNHPIMYRYIQDLIMFARVNKKKIFFLLLENDYGKKVVGQIEMLVDKVTNLGAKVSLAKGEAVKLMENLFGANAGKIIKKSREKKPELLLNEFETILSKLVGPENAKKQTRELYGKYVKAK